MTNSIPGARLLRSVQFSPMGTIPLKVTCTIQHSHRSMEAVAQENIGVRVSLRIEGSTESQLEGRSGLPAGKSPAENLKALGKWTSVHHSGEAATSGKKSRPVPTSLLFEASSSVETTGDQACPWKSQSPYRDYCGCRVRRLPAIILLHTLFHS